jgi:hypothetical protein
MKMTFLSETGIDSGDELECVWHKIDLKVSDVMFLGSTGLNIVFDNWWC